MVRPAQFRVDWVRAGGRRITGPPIRYRPVPITQEDRAALSAEAAGTSLSVPSTSGRRVVRPSRMPELPKEKPPFVRQETMIDPLERVSVRASQAADDSVTTFYVVDGQGTARATVRMPPFARLVGLARERMFLVIPDPEEMELLYAVPYPL